MDLLVTPPTCSPVPPVPFDIPISIFTIPWTAAKLLHHIANVYHHPTRVLHHPTVMFILLRCLYNSITSGRSIDAVTMYIATTWYGIAKAENIRSQMFSCQLSVQDIPNLYHMCVWLGGWVGPAAGTRHVSTQVLSSIKQKQMNHIFTPNGNHKSMHCDPTQSSSIQTLKKLMIIMCL